MSTIIQDFTFNLSTFRIDGEADGYKLHIGNFSGNAGDSFSYHNGMEFSTIEKGPSKHCANSYKGGWWYKG